MLARLERAFRLGMSLSRNQEHQAGQRHAEQDAGHHTHHDDVKKVLNYPIPRAIHLQLYWLICTEMV